MKWGFVYALSLDDLILQVFIDSIMYDMLKSVWKCYSVLFSFFFVEVIELGNCMGIWNRDFFSFLCFKHRWCLYKTLSFHIVFLVLCTRCLNTDGIDTGFCIFDGDCIMELVWASLSYTWNEIFFSIVCLEHRWCLYEMRLFMHACIYTRLIITQN